MQTVCHCANGRLYFQFACELRPLPRQTRDRRQNENGHKGCLCADVVLGFLSPPGAGSNGVPLQLLYDFERMHIKAGATGLVTLRTSPKDFTQLDEEAVRYALPGEYTFRFGVKETAPHGGGWATTTLTMKTDDDGGLDARKL